MRVIASSRSPLSINADTSVAGCEKATVYAQENGDDHYECSKMCHRLPVKGIVGFIHNITPLDRGRLLRSAPNEQACQFL